MNFVIRSLIFHGCFCLSFCDLNFFIGAEETSRLLGKCIYFYFLLNNNNA